MKWRFLRWAAGLTGALVLLAVGGLIMLGWSSKRPDNLGPHGGRLADLPETPNAVASYGTGEQVLEPLSLARHSADDGWQALRRVLAEFPRTKVIRDEPGYLYVECSTPWLGFVDDVEFLLDGEQIHFRSASRVGRSDLGANARRMQQIRELWREALAKTP